MKLINRRIYEHLINKINSFKVFIFFSKIGVKSTTKGIIDNSKLIIFSFKYEKLIFTEIILEVYLLIILLHDILQLA